MMNTKAETKTTEILITGTTNETSLSSPAYHAIGRRHFDASSNSISGEGRVLGRESSEQINIADQQLAEIRRQLAETFERRRSTNFNAYENLYNESINTVEQGDRLINSFRVQINRPNTDVNASTRAHMNTNADDVLSTITEIDINYEQYIQTLDTNIRNAFIRGFDHLANQPVQELEQLRRSIWTNYTTPECIIDSIPYQSIHPLHEGTILWFQNLGTDFINFFLSHSNGSLEVIFFIVFIRMGVWFLQWFYPINNWSRSTSIFWSNLRNAAHAALGRIRSIASSSRIQNYQFNEIIRNGIREFNRMRNNTQQNLIQNIPNLENYFRWGMQQITGYIRLSVGSRWALLLSPGIIFGTFFAGRFLINRYFGLNRVTSNGLNSSDPATRNDLFSNNLPSRNTIFNSNSPRTFYEFIIQVIKLLKKS